MNKKQKEKWIELYYVMQQIDTLDPWHKLTEDAVFIYRRKDGQEIFYRILGEKYGYCAIACYIGAENYIRSKAAMLSRENGRHAICFHDALIGIYDDRELLSNEDREIIKELGIKCRGKGAWLHFNSYTSGKVPAQLTDEELYTLADALGNFYMMLKAVFADNMPIDLKKQALLRFHKEGGEFEWYNMASDDAFKQYGSENISLIFDNTTTTKYFSKKKATKKEVAVMLVMDDNKMTMDDGSKGYSAMIMMIDTSNGMPLDVRCVPASVDIGNDLLNAICDVCERFGKPKRFICDDHFVEALTADFLNKIKSEMVYMTAEEIDSRYGRNLSESAFMNGLLSDGMFDLMDDEEEHIPEIKMTENKKKRKKKTKESDIPDNTYVISVSMGKGCYRHIAVSGRYTLEDLSDIILDVFEFDNDHMHAFFMDNKPYSEADAYYCRYDEEEERHTCDHYIGEVISDKQKFLYVFDFGDDWEFSCRVLKIQDEPCEEWDVIRSVGDPPMQYPFFDDEEFE